MAFPVGENDQEVIVFLCNKDLAQPLCSDTCCITGCSLPRPCILQVLYTNPCSHTQLLYASFFSIQRIPFKMEKMEKVLLFLWYLDFTLVSSDPPPPFPLLHINRTGGHEWRECILIWEECRSPSTYSQDWPYEWHTSQHTNCFYDVPFKISISSHFNSF